jgi:thiamine biosynthesis lipoprotein
MMIDRSPGFLPGHPLSIRILIFLITSILLIPGCAGNRRPHSETRFMMGTLVEIVVYADQEIAAAAVQKAFLRMGEVEETAYVRGEKSPLNPLREGRGVVLMGDAALIMELALKVSRATSGAFDPTLGEVVELWGFGMDNPRLPDGGEIKTALERAGYERIPEQGCCPDGTRLWFDLGGVAKGYAVDEAVRILKGSGIGSGIVNAGGDLRSFGVKPRSRLWKIGIQDPDKPQELAGVMEVGEISVATSGDYQRYFEKDGIRYHHILDSTNGYPARSGIRSVTVLAPDCALADALATAAFVMGPEKGLELLERWDDVEGLLIADDGTYHVTSGIGEKFPFERR